MASALWAAHFRGLYVSDVLQRVTGSDFVIVSVTIATGYADCVICATELEKVATVSASTSISALMLILCVKRGVSRCIIAKTLNLL
jgi:uncharacterized protein (UPF0212 family)